MKPNRAARRAKQREWERTHAIERILRDGCMTVGQDGEFERAMCEQMICGSSHYVPPPFDPMGGTFAIVGSTPTGEDSFYAEAVRSMQLDQRGVILKSRSCGWSSWLDHPNDYFEQLKAPAEPELTDLPLMRGELVQLQGIRIRRS